VDAEKQEREKQNSYYYTIKSMYFQEKYLRNYSENTGQKQFFRRHP